MVPARGDEQARGHRVDATEPQLGQPCSEVQAYPGDALHAGTLSHLAKDFGCFAGDTALRIDMGASTAKPTRTPPPCSTRPWCGFTPWAPGARHT